MTCPLCTGDICRRIASDSKREYVHCTVCSLVFVPPVNQITLKEELARYALHDNTETNEGYVRYLGETADAVMQVLVENGSVLDYGCGENAVLTGLLRERGVECIPFDPLYDKYRHGDAGGGRFDLIVLNEVIEHCRDIRSTIADIERRLVPGGKVLVRTQFLPGTPEEVARWWYAQDPTHILFFSPQSLAEVARQLGRNLQTTARKDIHLVS